MAQVTELVPKPRGKQASKKAKAKREKTSRKKSKATKAAKADKYKLYQRSVQDPDTDLDFIENVYEERFGKKPHDIREDFCGTAWTACRWVKRDPENRAWGIDLDPEPLAWGRANNAVKLDEEQASRLTLIEGDVLASSAPPADVILAQNFSYCIFKTRDELRNYFEKAREGLADNGMFVLDIFGGPDAQRDIRDRTKHKGHTYVWDQAYYDAITNEILCHIHFEFQDGSKMKKAFTYDWRLWTIPELKELLIEAGFSRADAYWEGPGEDGTGDGVFVRKSNAENEDAWIAYVVGGK